MSAQSSTSVVAEQEATTSSKDMSLEQKIGMAKKFDREMKDYAKATVKEFLGIYGYEEDVEINMDDSETQKCPSSANTSEAEKPLESNTTTASTSACEVTTGSERPVSSVSISSSSAANAPEESSQIERSSRREDTPGQSVCLGTFSWDEYLAETKGIAAPWTCFKQAATPPFNGFQCGMKLEAADPQNKGAVCVATVVGVIGSRLRLRFDGCENSRDIWRVIDSGDIHPVGWCEGNGGILKPPLGFRTDVTNFTSFLQKTLANGELAPLRLFKKEPNTPKVNLFCPTFKVEAVDLNNPALICVGTVVSVIGDDVMIAFDGWKETAYTYPFYSRDIFPPGWCYFSGHPLQPPGPEYAKFKNTSSQKELPPVQPLDADDRPTQSTRSIKASFAVENSFSVENDPQSGEPTIDLVFSIPVPVELFVNFACDFGSYLDPLKVAELRPVYRGNVREVLQSSIQAIVNAAYNPSIVIGFLRPGRGKIVIKAQHGHDTYTCCLQSVDHIWVFWNVFGRFTDNLRCCKNLFSSEKVQGVCPKCQSQGKKRFLEAKKLAEDQNKRNEERRSQALQKEELVAKKAKRVIREEVREGEKDEEIVSDVGSTSSPLTWSTDEVVEYFKKSDISKYAEIFRQHEIDGGALVLLNRETIMTCMQFKLGPALKLLNHITELKKKFSL